MNARWAPLSSSIFSDSLAEVFPEIDLSSGKETRTGSLKFRIDFQNISGTWLPEMLFVEESLI